MNVHACLTVATPFRSGAQDYRIRIVDEGIVLQVQVT